MINVFSVFNSIICIVGALEDSDENSLFHSVFTLPIYHELSQKLKNLFYCLNFHLKFTV